MYIGGFAQSKTLTYKCKKEKMNTDTSVGISVGEMKGLRADFEDKVAGEKGREWLEAFKLFLKKQNPWPVVIEESKDTAILLKLSKGYEDAKSVEMLRELIEEFPSPDREILKMYYFENLRISEIAEAKHLEESEVCRIQAKYIVELRDKFALTRLLKPIPERAFFLDQV